jgi:hypothetical protein
MSFIKNPFRKADKVKAHQKTVSPTINRAINQKTAQTGAQGTTGKTSLPKNYLDPNSVF